MKQICSEIRQQIIDKSIPPGSKLSDVALARMFKVSRTPVREALRQLEAEGFLTHSAHRGFAVNVITIDDVDQIYGLRMCIEGYAGRLAMPIISGDPKKLEILEQMCEAMEMSCRQKDASGYLKKNREFHSYIWNSCENKWLIRVLENLRSHIDRFIVNAIQIPSRIEKSILEHWEIYNAFKNQDEKMVEKAISNHFKNVSLDLKKQLTGIT